MMRVALVLTVKNEARILRQNLLYHHAIGAERIYVYFDGSTDAGKKSIQDLDFVTTKDSVPGFNFDSNEYLRKFTSKADEHHTARQCLNTYDAQQQCAKAGIDWLISIDADELVCLNADTVVSLPNFFSTIDPEVEVVYLKTQEALQQKEVYTNVFSEEQWFKTMPFYKNRLARIYKELANPITGVTERFSYWYGQTMGKGAVRVGCDIIPHNVHRYKKIDGSKPRSISAGMVLHYHAYDADDFIKKFQNFSNRPSTFLSGNPVNRFKILLRDVVNSSGLSTTELRHYFVDNLLFHQNEVVKLQKNRIFGVFKRNPPPLKKITAVHKTFKSINT